VLLGTRVNFLLGFGQEPFMPARQTLVQIDVEPEEMDSNRTVDLSLAGDLAQTLAELNRRGVPTGDLGDWRLQLEGLRRAFDEELSPLATSPAEPIHPLRLAEEIEAVREPGSFIVADGGNSTLWALMAEQRHRKGGLVVSTLGDLEAIGAGVPHAVGLKLAAPDRQVILHSGDGSFGYGAMEFETAVRRQVPIVTVVHNDGGWGMTRDMQAAYFGVDREIGNRHGTVRYDLLVAALGGHGEHVERPEELAPALHRALAAGRPACVNVMVDPEPRSPGLEMFMLMEVMLGKRTYLDHVPAVLRRLRRMGLDGAASRLMLKNIEGRLHAEMT
jgi:acetolactate synthase I/II/III large subunit